MTNLDLSALEAAATERAANGLSGMNVSPPTMLALLAEVAALRQQVVEVEAERAKWQRIAEDCTRAVEAAEQTVAALARVIEDVTGAHRIAADAVDRFRDVVSECLGLDENPGDDALVEMIRAHFGNGGPEPRRWRDFMVGAEAMRDQILAAAPTPPAKAEEKPVVHPNRFDERDVRPWRPEDGDARCQHCGRPNIVWYTDHDLWNRVMPDDGVLCIGCFIHRAESGSVPVGSVWALWHESIPTSSDFQRGYSAGLATRTPAPPTTCPQEATEA